MNPHQPISDMPSHTPHVLVIDDELFARRVLESALTRSGFTVTLVSSVADGLQALTQQRFDAVTCDLMMPIESGLDFLRRAKAHPTYKNIPIVMISAAGMQSELAQAKSLGANAVVNKPFTIGEIKQTLTEVLQSRTKPFLE
jgi:CheY-like chemotaxis protein